MSDQIIRNALDELFARHAALIAEKAALNVRRAEIDTEIAKLTPKIVSLSTVCEDIDPQSELGQFLLETTATGLTDGVRAVLRGNGDWMAAIDIRNSLLRLGYNLSGYANAGAAIHTVLKRLTESQEVMRGIQPKTKKTVFKWKTPSAVAASTPTGEAFRQAAEKVLGDLLTPRPSPDARSLVRVPPPKKEKYEVNPLVRGEEGSPQNKKVNK